jgi:CheY-like chemotaxis protein
VITTPPDEAGQLTCPQCGARLRARPTAPASKAAAEAAPPILEAILAELKVLRERQDQILGLLQGQGTDGAPQWDADGPAGPPALRSRRRKSALVIDDDVATRIEATQALERAEVPVRAAADGRAGLSAIAEEKPDVIILELGLGGSMAGKDVINLIKATMEWVDIPIVLYTRVPVESQKEARIVHGADEFLPKAAGPEALVAKVVQAFRRG